MKTEMTEENPETVQENAQNAAKYTEDGAETFAGAKGELSELEAALAEVSRFRELALRTQADLENYRKRAQREKEEASRFANGYFLERLLPVVDNFELGLQAAETATDAKSIVTGMSMVHRQIIDFLKDNGVEEVSIEGAFDPNIHEALSQESSDSVPEGGIVRQLRKGYRLRDRLLRAANVIVSKGPE
jgi:molecular chaperone GrpE